MAEFGCAVPRLVAVLALLALATPPDPAFAEPYRSGPGAGAMRVGGLFGPTGGGGRKGVTPLFQSFGLGVPKKSAVPRVQALPQAPRAALRPVPKPVAAAPVAAAPATGGKRYRTMCVRECDGYYYPISFRTSRGNFEDDAKACAASCEAPARLFYYINPGEDLSAMRDLEGRPYGKLKNAFRYRKELVVDCRCRPDPWSAEARQRHAGYGTELEQGAAAGDAGPDEGGSAGDAAPEAAPSPPAVAWKDHGAEAVREEAAHAFADALQQRLEARDAGRR